MSGKAVNEDKKKSGLDDLAKKIAKLEKKDLKSEEAVELIDECVKMAGDLIEE